MSHTTFYRKYRSQSFNQLIGQTHIVQTLTNAIEHERLSHAYIFSGPRGTGKTSSARILAKRLNCTEKSCHTLNSKSKDTCEKCQKIANGHMVDIVEIDAASNTGVDNIRNLNEQVNFMPVECTYKIYIIDEAHMLSTGAFNALLKTLEEPPEKTIFVLATTEPQKIPITIHSRCQHLHFRRMTIPDIMSHLTQITKAESITIEEKALFMIAKQADGCMRDALSLLDQVYSCKGSSISEADVMSLLGTAHYETFVKILECLFTGDAEALCNDFTSLFQEGVNPQQLLGDLVGIFKQLLFIKLSIESSIELDKDRQEQLATLMKDISFESIQHLLETVCKLESECRYFPDAELIIMVRFLAMLQFLKNPTAPTPPPSVAAPRPSSSASKPTYSPTPTRTPPPPTPVSPSQPAPASSEPIRIAPIETKVSPIDSDVQHSWNSCLATIKQSHRGLYTILIDSICVERTAKSLFVKLKQDVSFFRKKLAEPAMKANLESIIKDIFGQDLSFEVTDKSPAPVTPTPAPNATPDVAVTDSTPQDQAPAQPKPPSQETVKTINQVVDIFEGSVSS